jgi:hypothetical protein
MTAETTNNLAIVLRRILVITELLFGSTAITADRVYPPQGVLCPAIVPTQIFDWIDLHLR